MLPIVKQRVKQKLIQHIKHKDHKEIKIQSIIKTIPYFDLYFYTFFSYDDVKLGIMETEDDIEEITMQNQLVSLKYKYIPQHPYEEYMLNKKSIKYLFDIHTYLVRGINKLDPYNIIHFDINNNNIIISQEVPLIKISNKCLYLLDSDFIKEYKLLFNRHPHYKPFEMHVIYYLLETSQQSISISNIYYLWDEYSRTQDKTTSNDGINFLKTFINLPIHHIIEELLKYSSTWNQYFVSLFILRELKDKHYSTTNNFVLKWKEWLHASTNIDPRNRINNMDQLNEIMVTADIKDL